MLLGTQWYILFNVIAGATAIPADLREAARIYRVGTLQRFRELYLPAIFPYLVTGWVTAAGGAWNASIVSEYVSFRGQVLAANGLGARISVAAASGDFAVLAAAITRHGRRWWRSSTASSGAACTASPRSASPSRGSEDPMPEATRPGDDRRPRPSASSATWTRSSRRANGPPLRVLEDISLAIRPNEVVALLGPVRLRQVHHPAHPGRAHRADARARCSTTARRSPASTPASASSSRASRSTPG